MTPAEIIAAAREIVEWRDNGEKPLVVSNSIQQFGLMFARELLCLHDDAEALRAALKMTAEECGGVIIERGFLAAELAEAKAALDKFLEENRVQQCFRCNKVYMRSKIVSSECCGCAMIPIVARDIVEAKP